MISILAQERLLGFALGSALTAFVIFEQRKLIHESVSNRKSQSVDQSQVISIFHITVSASNQCRSKSRYKLQPSGNSALCSIMVLAQTSGLSGTGMIYISRANTSWKMIPTAPPPAYIPLQGPLDVETSLIWRAYAEAQ